jgi:hypothetical protein
MDHKMSFAQNIGRNGKRPLRLVSRIAVLAVALATPAVGEQAERGERLITCTNPFSGVSWQIKIDYDRSMADSNPARIDQTRISWRDSSDGRNYSLDRKSGKLTVVVASATGGNFLYDRCDLGN